MSEENSRNKTKRNKTKNKKDDVNEGIQILRKFNKSKHQGLLHAWNYFEGKRTYCSFKEP